MSFSGYIKVFARQRKKIKINLRGSFSGWAGWGTRKPKKEETRARLSINSSKS